MQTWLLIKHEFRAGLWYLILAPLVVSVYSLPLVQFPLPLWCLALFLVLSFAYREFCPDFAPLERAKQLGALEFMFTRAIARHKWLLAKNLFFWCACFWPLLPAACRCLTVSGHFDSPSAAALFLQVWLAALLCQALFYYCRAQLWLIVLLWMLSLPGLVILLALGLDLADYQASARKFCAGYFLPLTAGLLALTVWLHYHLVRRLSAWGVY
ncbi:MAG: hypothetical protein LBK76_08605 [Verrucomicrobiales bacterium]|jgi:hypothetical protein|nr:hypothetical protein [Verrucomicrobiales bacterium]